MPELCDVRRFLSLGFCVLICFPGLLLAGDGGARAGDAIPQVTVDLQSARVESFVGMGIQWDPYSYPPRPEAWRQTLHRLDFARPAFFRVMTGARSYCLGFDAAGEPSYVWTKGEEEIRRRLGTLLDILDCAQSNRIEVLFGEWSPPGGLGGQPVSRPDDPRWARLVTDFVSWLRTARGYSCIRMYNLMNEPNGTWMWPGGRVDYTAWAAGVRNLRKAFDACGLRDLPIVGPDNSSNWEWVDRVSREMPDVIGHWEMHWYASDKDVFSGEIEKVLGAKRSVILQNDPGATTKRMFLAESGLVDGKVNGDQQPRVKTFEYGVMMADYAAQVMRGGWMGLCAWDLDDAMHTVRGHPPVPDEKTLKLWGFWNTQGTAMGQPEEENLRPWFYTWSLMSRLFPRDARILTVTQPGLSNLRVVAAQRRKNGGLSLMLVNNTNSARQLKVVIPGAGKKTLAIYHYFEKDRPTDAEGFAIPRSTVSDANLSAGVNVTLPERGVIFLETK